MTATDTIPKKASAAERDEARLRRREQGYREGWAQRAAGKRCENPYSLRALQTDYGPWREAQIALIRMETMDVLAPDGSVDRKRYLSEHEQSIRIARLKTCDTWANQRFAETREERIGFEQGYQAAEAAAALRGEGAILAGPGQVVISRAIAPQNVKGQEAIPDDILGAPLSREQVTQLRKERKHGRRASAMEPE